MSKSLPTPAALRGLAIEARASVRGLKETDLAAQPAVQSVERLLDHILGPQSKFHVFAGYLASTYHASFESWGDVRVFLRDNPDLTYAEAYYAGEDGGLVQVGNYHIGDCNNDTSGWGFLDGISTPRPEQTVYDLCPDTNPDPAQFHLFAGSDYGYGYEGSFQSEEGAKQFLTENNGVYSPYQWSSVYQVTEDGSLLASPSSDDARGEKEYADMSEAELANVKGAFRIYGPIGEVDDGQGESGNLLDAINRVEDAAEHLQTVVTIRNADSQSVWEIDGRKVDDDDDDEDVPHSYGPDCRWCGDLCTLSDLDEEAQAPESETNSAFSITTLEKFGVRAYYTVTAKSRQAAEQMVRDGEVGYDSYEKTEDDEFIGIESVDVVIEDQPGMTEYSSDRLILIHGNVETQDPGSVIGGYPSFAEIQTFVTDRPAGFYLVMAVVDSGKGQTSEPLAHWTSAGWKFLLSENLLQALKPCLSGYQYLLAYGSKADRENPTRVIPCSTAQPAVNLANSQEDAYWAIVYETVHPVLVSEWKATPIAQYDAEAQTDSFTTGWYVFDGCPEIDFGPQITVLS